MYDFLLTNCVLSGWMTSKFPGVDWLSHNAGHLLEELFGWRAHPHFGPSHIASNILILVGFMMLASSWKMLYQAQRHHVLSTTGRYARIHHPQYVALVVIMFGFLLQ